MNGTACISRLDQKHGPCCERSNNTIGRIEGKCLYLRLATGPRMDPRVLPSLFPPLWPMAPRQNIVCISRIYVQTYLWKNLPNVIPPCKRQQPSAMRTFRAAVDARSSKGMGYRPWNVTLSGSNPWAVVGCAEAFSVQRSRTVTKCLYTCTSPLLSSPPSPLLSPILFNPNPRRTRTLTMRKTNSDTSAAHDSIGGQIQRFENSSVLHEELRQQASTLLAPGLRHELVKTLQSWDNDRQTNFLNKIYEVCQQRLHCLGNP